MCTIRDIVEIRAVNPPVQLWTVRKDYTLFRDVDNRLCATFSDVPVQGSSVQYRTNEMLIDALEAGEQLENGRNAEAVFTAWIEKYGITKIWTENYFLEEHYPNKLTHQLHVIYTVFCEFLRIRYGYEVFPNEYLKNDPESCRAEAFSIPVEAKTRVVFDGCTIKTVREDSGLMEALLYLLADFATTDNGWQQFTCRMCGKTSLRRNPKKCYCNECTGKRYQVSRQKKRLEGR